MSHSRAEPDFAAKHSREKEDQADKLTERLMQMLHAEIAKETGLCPACTLNLMTMKLMASSIMSSGPEIIQPIMAVAGHIVAESSKKPAGATTH